MARKKTTITWPIATLLIVGGGAAIYGLSKALKKSKDQRTREEIIAAQQSTVPVPGTTANINLYDVASQIADALGTKSGWWSPYSWTEDEERVIALVGTVPKSYIPQLQLEYFNQTDSNLREDLVDLLSASDWGQIANKFS